MAIELCLFDLDNTLLRTSDLEQFRGSQNVNVSSPAYSTKLINAAFGHGAPKRHIYTLDELIDLRRKFPQMRWGVFTRSPRHYANTLLSQAYPNLRWDAIVGYEDVQRTKPHPDGIWLAAKQAGVSSLDRIALVGDEKVDVVCTYRAGCWSFIDQTTWHPRTNEHWWTLERVPDALFQGASELEELLVTPNLRLPELEYLATNEKLDGRQPRIEKINHFFPKSIRGGYVPINILGRLFGDYEELKYKRQSHLITGQIHAHKDATNFPNTWAAAILSYLRKEIRMSDKVVVTVIPFKPGRTPRLERLLSQVGEAFRPAKVFVSRLPTVDFLDDVLAFRNGAISSHAHHLSQEERFKNVRENLYVKRPHDVAGKHVIVIDDVVTSGATLLWADFFLRQANAQQVSCLSLTKAIGPN